jgi:hypothetical protein
MKRLLFASLALFLAASAVQAHFVWILPGEGNKVKVVFSDQLAPDQAELLDRIKHTKLFALDEKGEQQELKLTKVDNCFEATLPAGAKCVHGHCVYGVFQRGEGKPMLLTYYATCNMGNTTPALNWDTMPIQVKQEKPGMFTILHANTPLANTDVVVYGPEGFKQQTLKTNTEGTINLDLSTAPKGTYGLRILQSAAKAGTHEGKKYEETRTYLTYVFTHGTATAGLHYYGAREISLVTKGDDTVTPAGKEDPEASKLLAEARAARAGWTNFPGFTADMEVNIDGKVYKASVTVDAKGKLQIADLDKTAEPWVKRTMASLVSHRLGDTASMQTPCAFADQEANHPQGRLVNVLNDEMHSSYRIKDQQIMVVNRMMGESKFSITMLENRKNEEGKYLPTTFVVHYWDAKTGQLTKAESNLQTWTRVGGFDLPTVVKVITVGKEVNVKQLTLSNHKLLSVAAK